MKPVLKKTASIAVLNLLLGTTAFSVDTIDHRITAGHINKINAKFERQMGLTLSQQEARQAAQDLFINCTPDYEIKNRIIEGRARVIKVADDAVQQNVAQYVAPLVTAPGAPEPLVVVPMVSATQAQTGVTETVFAAQEQGSTAPAVDTSVVSMPMVSSSAVAPLAISISNIHTPKVTTLKIRTLKTRTPNVHAPRINPLKVTTLRSNAPKLISSKASENNQLVVGTKTFIFDQNAKDQVFNFVINNEVMKNLILSNVTIVDDNTKNPILAKLIATNAKKEAEVLRKIINNLPALYVQMTGAQKKKINLHLANFVKYVLTEGGKEEHFNGKGTGVLSLSLNTPIAFLPFSGVDGGLISEGDRLLERLNQIIRGYPTIDLIREYNIFESLFSTNPVHAERVLTSNIISTFGNRILNLLETEKNRGDIKKQEPKIISAIRGSEPRVVEVFNEDVVEPIVEKLMHAMESESLKNRLLPKVVKTEINVSNVEAPKVLENNQLVVGTKTFIFDQNAKDQVFNVIINNPEIKKYLLSNVSVFDKNTGKPILAKFTATDAVKEEMALRKILNSLPELLASMNGVQKNEAVKFLGEHFQSGLIENRNAAPLLLLESQSYVAGKVRILKVEPSKVEIPSVNKLQMVNSNAAAPTTSVLQEEAFKIEPNNINSYKGGAFTIEAFTMGASNVRTSGIDFSKIRAFKMYDPQFNVQGTAMYKVDLPPLNRLSFVEPTQEDLNEAGSESRSIALTTFDGHESSLRRNSLSSSRQNELKVLIDSGTAFLGGMSDTVPTVPTVPTVHKLVPTISKTEDKEEVKTLEAPVTPLKVRVKRQISKSNKDGSNND